MYYHYGKWGRGCPLLRGKNVLSLWEVEISGITPSPLLSKEVVLFFGGSTISKVRMKWWYD